MTRPENLAGSCEAALDVPLLYFLLGLKRNLLSRVVRVESEPPPLSARATMLSYPLTIFLFQSRPIPLPMAYGLATLNLLALDLSGSIRRAMNYPL
jgi:hypothetical protein